MKNKNKSKKVQAKIQQMQKAAVMETPAERKKREAKQREKVRMLQSIRAILCLFFAHWHESQEAKKAAAAAKKANDALMYGSTVAIKQKVVPPGVDPKSIVCEFFRAGRCTKGNKCVIAQVL